MVPLFSTCFLIQASLAESDWGYRIFKIGSHRLEGDSLSFDEVMGGGGQASRKVYSVSESGGDDEE